MLNPVGIVTIRVEDREIGKRENRKRRKPDKKTKEPVLAPSLDNRGDQLDLRA